MQNLRTLNTVPFLSGEISIDTKYVAAKVICVAADTRSLQDR